MMNLIYGFSCVGVIFITQAWTGYCKNKLYNSFESLEVLEYNFVLKTESFGIEVVRMHLAVFKIINFLKCSKVNFTAVL